MAGACAPVLVGSAVNPQSAARTSSERRCMAPLITRHGNTDPSTAGTIRPADLSARRALNETFAAFPARRGRRVRGRAGPPVRTLQADGTCLVDQLGPA